MNTYNITFQTYGGNPPRVVTVQATDRWQAERVARFMNPGFHAITLVEVQNVN